MSVRTCTVICNCGPNGEPLRCGYKPKHEGAHSWATLPTFVKPPVGPVEIHAADAMTAGLAVRGVAVMAMPEWWLAVCSSLGYGFPHALAIRTFIESGGGPS